MMKYCTLSRGRRALNWSMNGFLVLALILQIDRVNAQTQRDPTVPPVEAGEYSSSAVSKSRGKDIEPGVMALIVRNGRSYLAVGTRLYAQGQKIGLARIERISETEVWLREGGVLRKVSQFPGIQRRAVTPVVALPTCTVASSTKPSSPVAPCA